jgi:2-succinyl-6-hydroxy-2,4-cyclohexadiene-1-carboxylate synthase
MEWTTHRFDFHGDRLAVHERPAPAHDPGPAPLVLLHGFTGHGRSWERVAQHLPFVRILAPDLPGHGDSPWREDPAEGRFADVATRLCAAFDRLGVSRCNLAGYSMGGRCALYLAVEHPRRVARLILESASPGLESPDARRARREADAALGAFAVDRGIVAFVDRWETTPVLAEHRLDARTRCELRAQRLLCRPQGLAASLSIMGTGAQPYVGGRLAECEAPALLVVGEADAKFRRIATSMCDGFPSSRTEVVPNAGHNVHVEHPQVFAELVADFAYGRRFERPQAATEGKITTEEISSS